MNLDVRSYIPLFPINLGQFKIHDPASNAKGFIDILNILFFLESSGELEENPNILIKGVRVVPLFIVIFIVILIFVGRNKIKKANQEVLDLIKNIEK